MMRYVVRGFAVIATVLWALLAARVAIAQSPSSKPAGAENVSLTTRDGLVLKAAYYAAPDDTETGTKTGKQTVPVLMLHDHKSSRNVFDALAKSFQSKGYSVIVPDLRGHGESTKFVNSPRRDLEAAKLRPQDFVDMLQYDLRAVRKFLVGKNDEGELNLNRLCLVGAEMGAVLAVNWTAQDWSWPDLPGAKQGRDVKALILISPEWAFKRLRISNALAQRDLKSDRISFLLLVGGRNSKAVASAKRIYKSLAPFHVHAEHDEPVDFKIHTLFLAEIETSLQGTKLLAVPGVDFANDLAEFFKQRGAEPDFPWTERRRGG